MLKELEKEDRFHQPVEEGQFNVENYVESVDNNIADMGSAISA